MQRLSFKNDSRCNFQIVPKIRPSNIATYLAGMARRRLARLWGGDGPGWRGEAEVGWDTRRRRAARDTGRRQAGMARRRQLVIRGGDGTRMARRRRVRRAGVPQRVRHCCGRSRAPVHRRLRKEEEDAAPECSPGRELVRGQQVEIRRLSVTRGGGARARGRADARARGRARG